MVKSSGKAMCFKGAQLIGARLDGVTWEKSDLSGGDLNGCYLLGAELVDCSLRGANFKKATLKGAMLDRLDVAGCDFSTADLTDVQSNKVDFHSAILEDTDTRNLRQEPGATIPGCSNQGLPIRAVSPELKGGPEAAFRPERPRSPVELLFNRPASPIR